MTTDAFIVARLNSSRLPQKNIMPIMGKPMIGHLVDRIRASSRIDRIIIATSDLASDDPLEAVACDLGVDSYRGSLNNIMERIVGAAKAFESQTIVEILGDNPLVHSAQIDDLLAFYDQGGYDYSATLTKEYQLPSPTAKRFPVGIRVQIYSLAAAEKYNEYPEYADDNNKHPCAFLFDHPDRFRLGYLEADNHWTFLNRPDLSFAVNYGKNFDLIRIIYERLLPVDPNFDLQQVLRFLDQNSDLYQMMGAEEA